MKSWIGKCLIPPHENILVINITDFISLDTQRRLKELKKLIQDWKTDIQEVYGLILIVVFFFINL